MSDISNPGGSAPGLPSAAVLFLIWAFSFYLARIWSKLGKTDLWGLDGTIISLAMVMSIAHVISIYYAWHRGYGNGWEDQSDTSDRSAIKKSLYAAQIFFVVSIGLTRSSTALFTARVLRLDERSRRLALVMITVCGTSTAVLFFAIALRSPLTQPWNTLNGSQEMFVRWLIIEVVGLAIDIGTLVFSVITVWRIQMSIWKRLTVCALFAVRLLIVPVVACRLVQLHPTAHELTTGYNSAENILTEAELQLFLVLSSATCLKPLFQPFHPGFFAATSANLAVTGYTNRPGNSTGSRDPYYELSRGGDRIEKDTKQPISRVVPEDDASDEINLVQPQYREPAVAAMRPDESESWSEAVAASNTSPPRSGDGRRIEATRTWTVSYEERNTSN